MADPSFFGGGGEPWERRGENDARIRGLEVALAAIQTYVAITPGERTGVSLRRTGTQSIDSATPTAISWDTEDFDSDDYIAAPATTVTLPGGTGGFYAITVRGHWSAQPTGRAFLSIVAGGADYRMPTDDEDEIVNTVYVPLAATNTIVVNVFQTSAGALDFTGALFAYRIGA